MKDYCCVECFSDDYIRRFIQADEELGDCDFCGSREVLVIEVAELAELIDRGIDLKYEDAAEQVSYESAEGGYLMDTFNVSEILLYEESIFDEESLDSPDTLASVLDHASKYYTVPLVRKQPYGDPSGDSKHLSVWERFCERLKHSSRFTMFRGYTQHIQAKDNQEDPPGDPTSEEYEFNEFWYDLDRFMHEMVDTIAADVPIYRTRLAEPESDFQHVDLTSPPLSSTRDGRMSPRGISYFYGAMDPETAIAEVRPYLGARIAVATFRTVSHVYVLDLTNLPEPVSIFDTEHYWFERDEFFLPFMHTFAWIISRPVSPDDEAMEYLPTQAFCEFLRLLHFGIMQGVKYRSAMRDEGACVVLFRGSDISIGNDPWLAFEGSRHVFVNTIAYGTNDTPPEESTAEKE